MEVKSVYIIFDEELFSIEDIKKDIQEEDYDYNFIFGFDSITPIIDFKIFLEEIDEVWVFGDCSNDILYKVAQEVGCDIWQMK